MLEQLIRAAEAGASEALKMKNDPKLAVSHKGDESWKVITDADPASQELISGRLTQAFPDIAILGEEGQTEEEQAQIMHQREFFTIDPIDGTLPFSEGHENWGTIVGYLKDRQPDAGVICVPERNTTIAARKDKGCLLNGKPVRLDYHNPLAKTIVEMELGPHIPENRWPAIVELAKSCHWLGGSGFVAAAIANIIAGRSGVYVNFNAKIWDFSASVIDVEEAGGCVAKPDGSEVTWDQIDMQVIFAANHQLLDETLAIIND